MVKKINSWNNKTNITNFKKYFLENWLNKKQTDERYNSIDKWAKEFLEKERNEIEENNYLAEYFRNDMYKKLEKVIIEKMILTKKYPSFKINMQDDSLSNKYITLKQFQKLVKNKEVMYFNFSFEVDMGKMKKLIEFCIKKPEDFVVFHIPYEPFDNELYSFTWKAKDFLNFLFDNKQINNDYLLFSEDFNPFISIKSSFWCLMEDEDLDKYIEDFDY